MQPEPCGEIVGPQHSDAACLHDQLALHRRQASRHQAGIPALMPLTSSRTTFSESPGRYDLRSSKRSAGQESCNVEPAPWSTVLRATAAPHAQYVTNVEELQRPGDFVTAEVAGAPILIAVDREGHMRAFHNVRRFVSCAKAAFHSTNSLRQSHTCLRICAT